VDMESEQETNTQSALDTELQRAATTPPDGEWREKVETAKEAREFGAQLRRVEGIPTHYNTFPRQ